MSIGHRNRSDLLISTALQTTVVVVLSLPAAAQPAPNARPTGGSVVGGAAAISQTGSNTRIEQSSQRAAIDWKSFNVGSQQSVTFSQPSANAVALNRVTGPDPSQIAGRIDANGQIILVNQSGVNFYKGAQVNAAGVMVSAAGISNQNFMAGVMKFDQPGDPNARIDNQGSITVKQAGLAALVAPRVANSGTITARLGHVVLAGAKTATLDLYGDGLLSLDVSDQVTQAPVGKDGRTATALVTNSGLVVADGGTVQLTARAADGIVQNLVQAGGQIRAATMGDHTGTVALNGVGGSIVVEGQLSAPGKAPGTKGGNIEVVSNGNVGIASTARIAASGKTGGGVIAIGTTSDRARGGPGVTAAMTATNVTVQQGATIAANAATNGPGGHVAILSQDTTRVAGTIRAKGGKNGGDGGFAEVSGEHLSLTGDVDLSAPGGITGTLLLDPHNLTIIHSSTASGSLDGTLGANAQIVYGDHHGGTDTVTDSEINSLDANILLQAVRTITLNSGTPLILGANKSLMLQTQTGDISIGSSITASGTGSIIMQAGTSLGSGGKLLLNGDLITDAAKGAITLQADGGINVGAAKLTGGTIDLSTMTSGGISQSSGGMLTAGTLTSSNGVAGDATLMSGLNDVGTIGVFNATGSFALSNATPLTVGGMLTASNITISTGGTLTVSNSLIATSAVSLTAASIAIPGLVSDGGAGSTNLIANAGTISETGTLIAGILSGNAMSSNAPQAVSLIGTNSIGTLAGFTASGFTLDDGTSLAVTGQLVAGTSATIVDTGALLVSGTIAPRSGTAAIAVGLTAATIDISGLVSDGGGGTTNLIANAGTIGETGALIAGTLSGSATSGVVPQAVNLIGANSIGTLAAFTASDFTLDDGISLAVTGPLIAGTSATIVDTGSLQVSGTIEPPSGSAAIAVGLTAATIDISGLVSDGGAGTTSLVANAGTIGESGTLIAGMLSGSATNGDVLQAVRLLGASNQIPTLGSFAASDFMLDDGPSLIVTGPLVAGKSAAIVDAGALLVSGTISPPPGTSAIAVGLTAATIDIPGSVSDGGAGTTSLVANAGTIAENGSVMSGTLSGSATGAANFSSGSNQISAASSFTASGLTLDNAADLAITGSVNGGPRVTLVDARTITVAQSGVVTGGTLSITAAGITESGTLAADLLTGNTAGNASLTGTGASNKVTQLGSFSSGGTFTLGDGTDLTIKGPLTAPTIIVDTGANALTLADKTVITTGGTVRPPGRITSFPGDTPATTTDGAFLTTAKAFSQPGSSSVLGFSGGPSILRINATGDADIAFDPLAGLQGPNTWLILALGTGTTIGQINVKNLDVIRGQNGGTDLTGTVLGVPGPAAAGVAGIQPGPNANFRFNQCAISSVNCLLLGGEAVPVANPLNNIYFGIPSNSNEEGDLLLPIVSDQDY
jgi:filamentous hemagglutinin family protein